MQRELDGDRRLQDRAPIHRVQVGVGAQAQQVVARQPDVSQRDRRVQPAQGQRGDRPVIAEEEPKLGFVAHAERELDGPCHRGARGGGGP